MRRFQSRTRGGAHTRDYYSGRRPAVQARQQVRFSVFFNHFYRFCKNGIPEREKNLSEETKSLLYGGRPRFNSSQRGIPPSRDRHERASQERFYSAFRTNKNDAILIRAMINSLMKKSFENGEPPQVLWYSDKGRPSDESDAGKPDELIETIFVCEETSLLPHRKIINSLRRDRSLQLEEIQIDENHPCVVSRKARLRAEINANVLRNSTYNFKRRESRDERNARQTEVFKNHCMKLSRERFLNRQKTAAVNSPEAMEVASSESGIESTISEFSQKSTAKTKDFENNEEISKSGAVNEYAVDFTEEQKSAIITKVKPQPAHGVSRRLPTPPGADDGLSLRSRVRMKSMLLKINLNYSSSASRSRLRFLPSLKQSISCANTQTLLSEFATRNFWNCQN